METFLSIGVGLGLAAACGFRVFVPLLVLSLASLFGEFSLPAGFTWMGSPYAALAFGTATVLEILGYYIPWFDSALDVISTPAAVIAGTLTAAAGIVDMPPLLKWTLAIIAGGGIAGLIQTSTVALRVKTSAVTGGLGNPVVSTLELVGALLIALLALFIPLAALILVGAFLIWMIRKVGLRMLGRPPKKNNG